MKSWNLHSSSKAQVVIRHMYFPIEEQLTRTVLLCLLVGINIEIRWSFLWKGKIRGGEKIVFVPEYILSIGKNFSEWLIQYSKCSYITSLGLSVKITSKYYVLRIHVSSLTVTQLSFIFFCKINRLFWNLPTEVKG